MNKGKLAALRYMSLSWWSRRWLLRRLATAERAELLMHVEALKNLKEKYHTGFKEIYDQLAEDMGADIHEHKKSLAELNIDRTLIYKALDQLSPVCIVGFLRNNREYGNTYLQRINGERKNTIVSLLNKPVKDSPAVIQAIEKTIIGLIPAASGE